MTNHGPNVDQVARDVLEDLGVVEDDRTEDLRSSAHQDGGLVVTTRESSSDRAYLLRGCPAGTGSVAVARSHPRIIDPTTSGNNGAAKETRK